MCIAITCAPLMTFPLITIQKDGVYCMTIHIRCKQETDVSLDLFLIIKPDNSNLHSPCSLNNFHQSFNFVGSCTQQIHTGQT
jgi:hypothetical protein